MRVVPNQGKRYDEAQVLEECLEMLEAGASLEECLESHPEGGEELRELLLTARHVDEIAKSIPTSEAKGRIWRGLALELTQEKATSKARPCRKGFGLRWAFATAGLLVVLMGSMVPISASSLPGEALYPVKLAAEEVRSVFTFTPAGKLELAAELADRRIGEMVELAAKGNKEGLEVTAARLNEHLDLMLEMADELSPTRKLTSLEVIDTGEKPVTVVGPTKPGKEVASIPQGLSGQLRQYAESASIALQKASALAPEDSLPILTDSLERVKASYEDVFGALDD